MVMYLIAKIINRTGIVRIRIYRIFELAEYSTEISYSENLIIL